MSTATCVECKKRAFELPEGYKPSPHAGTMVGTVFGMRGMENKWVEMHALGQPATYICPVCVAPMVGWTFSFAKFVPKNSPFRILIEAWRNSPTPPSLPAGQALKALPAPAKNTRTVGFLSFPVEGFNGNDLVEADDNERELLITGLESLELGKVIQKGKNAKNKEAIFKFELHSPDKHEALLELVTQAQVRRKWRLVMV